MNDSKKKKAINRASQVAIVVKNPPAKAGNVRVVGLIPGYGRSPGEVNGNPLQHYCLEDPMGKGAWQATVHRVAQSWTPLKGLSMHVQAINLLNSEVSLMRKAVL